MSSVNLEVKGTLARLLAQEDLLVEHKSVETASFNVQTRVLTLPRWEKASNNIADLLVAHEVGHALFTPNVDWRDMVKCPHGFVNVTEDVRIENLMKRKFAGLPKTFYRGYNELFNEDFFSLEGMDPNEMNVADRVNLYFKVGNFVKINFTDAEKVVVKQISDATTFEEALAAAEALYALHEEQKEEEQQESIEQSSGGDDGQSESEESGDEADNEGAQNEEVEQQKGDSGEGGEQGGQGDSSDEGEDSGETEEQPTNLGGDTATQLSDSVRTMEALEDKLGDLTATGTWDEPNYIDYPTPRKDVVVSSKEIYDYLHSKWKSQCETVSEGLGATSANEWFERNIGVHRNNFNKFKRDVQSEVNYLVKEFECKKSAAAYSRATTARTGVLDCAKLHTYKYNEDLFKKVTSLPEGKNHGLIFTLDWSGSMCNIMEDTVKQLLSLVMFCDKVNIPFKVFAFTNEWAQTPDSDGDRTYLYRPTDKFTEAGVFHVPAYFNMLTLLSSDVSRKVLYDQMADVYTLACLFNQTMGAYVPGRLMLSGTPLNEALVTLRSILPKFKAESGVEKAHVIVLTDGEAGGSIYTKQDRAGDRDFIRSLRLNWGWSNSSVDVYLRNRVTGTTRKMGDPTVTILEDLRQQFPDSSFTGFRIAERGATSWVRSACKWDEKIMGIWKKEKCVALSNQGYNKYYIMSASKLQEDAEFEVDENASKAKIKSAFSKSLKNKKTNKRILSDFIGEIA